MLEKLYIVNYDENPKSYSILVLVITAINVLGEQKNAFMSLTKQFIVLDMRIFRTNKVLFNLSDDVYKTDSFFLLSRDGKCNNNVKRITKNKNFFLIISSHDDNKTGIVRSCFIRFCRSVHIFDVHSQTNDRQKHTNNNNFVSFQIFFFT